MKEERPEEKKKEKRRREERSGAKTQGKRGRLTTRIIPMQLYNYNTFVHQADAINKWEKTRSPFSPTSLITGYNNLRICYIRRKRPTIGPSSDSERGQAEILTDVS